MARNHRREKASNFSLKKFPSPVVSLLYRYSQPRSGGPRLWSKEWLLSRGAAA